MRGIKGLFTDISALDPMEGITFRGYSIPELQKQLPTVKEEPLPEGLLWLMMTNQIPRKDDVMSLARELRSREALPKHTVHTIKNLPKDLHPMTQLSIGVLSLQKESEFLKAYNSGVHKTEYWEHAYEDALNLIARIPKVASLIYCLKYLDKDPLIQTDKNIDWAANFALEMHYKDEEFLDFMRLYQTIHADHEVGNVSAHTTHLVGSALSDPYYAFSAGLNGLAGPLHGLAN